MQVVDRGARLLAAIDPPAPMVSNVGFGADVGMPDGSQAPWPGEVYKVAIPVRQ